MSEIKFHNLAQTLTVSLDNSIPPELALRVSLDLTVNPVPPKQSNLGLALSYEMEEGGVRGIVTSNGPTCWMGITNRGRPKALQRARKSSPARQNFPRGTKFSVDVFRLEFAPGGNPFDDDDWSFQANARLGKLPPLESLSFCEECPFGALCEKRREGRGLTPGWVQTFAYTLHAWQTYSHSFSSFPPHTYPGLHHRRDTFALCVMRKQYPFLTSFVELTRPGPTSTTLRNHATFELCRMREGATDDFKRDMNIKYFDKIRCADYVVGPGLGANRRGHGRGFLGSEWCVASHQPDTECMLVRCRFGFYFSAQNLPNGHLDDHGPLPDTVSDWQKYNVEHIYDGGLYDPTGVTGHDHPNTESFANFVMSWGRWNQEMSSRHNRGWTTIVREKWFVYGPQQMTAVAELLDWCLDKTIVDEIVGGKALGPTDLTDLLALQSLVEIGNKLCLSEW